MNYDLAIALRDAKLTRAEFAAALGVSPTTVSNWSGFFPQYAVSYLAERKRAIELETMNKQLIEEVARGRK